MDGRIQIFVAVFADIDGVSFFAVALGLEGLSLPGAAGLKQDGVARLEDRLVQLGNGFPRAFRGGSVVAVVAESAST